MRERGNRLPLLIVLIVAIGLFVVVPLLIQRQNASRMASVEPSVLISNTASSVSHDSHLPTYRWPNGEVPRTAERLRDITGVSIAAATYLVEASMAQHIPQTAGEIVSNICGRGLIPGQWLTSEEGVLRTTNASIHLRYSARALSIEVVSVPNDHLDGPALLIRIPDTENTSLGSRYFESMQLDGVIYPEPFISISEIITAGWQPRLFKQTQLSDTERLQLEQWAKQRLSFGK